MQELFEATVMCMYVLVCIHEQNDTVVFLFYFFNEFFQICQNLLSWLLFYVELLMASPLLCCCCLVAGVGCIVLANSISGDNVDLGVVLASQGDM